MKDKLTVQETKEMFLDVANAIIEAENELTEIDNIIGDGDHGIGMRIGFQAVKETLPKIECKTINETFRATGMILLEAMGGASGVIFGTMFISGAAAGEDSDILEPKELAKFFSISLGKIKERGKAKLGDKTMIDSFEPAALSLVKSAEENKDLCQTVELAYKEALEGVERSKWIVANKGRAQAYAEATLGVPDPGAVSVSIIFGAMKSYMEA